MGVSKDPILKVYLTTIRPVLEYAVPALQSILDYLADVIRLESVILGPDIMKVSFNKKIDATFKRLQYHVAWGMLNVFTGVSDIFHNYT